MALRLDEWDYLILGRGAIEIHFYAEPGVDPLSTSASCHCFVDDARTLCREWTDLVVPDPPTGSRIVAPERRDYGMCEFALVDRNENLIRVGSPL